MTTEEVATAAGVAPATVRRWGRLGVLPPLQKISMGRRGTQTRWPLHAPEQARWVRSMLDTGHTFEEIRAALERGEFRSGSSDED